MDRFAQRFWAKVDRRGDDECWECTLKERPNGYVQIWSSFEARNGKRRKLYAHRIAYMLTKGEIPDGLEVCHTCDNGKCCNPRHLYAGTHSVNMADMKARGRHGFGHKLKRTEILEIRSSVGKMADIGKLFGVSAATICNIKARKTWALVE